MKKNGIPVWIRMAIEWLRCPGNRAIRRKIEIGKNINCLFRKTWSVLPFHRDFNYKWTIPAFYSIMALGMDLEYLFIPGKSKDPALFVTLGSFLTWVLYFMIILYPMDSLPEDNDDP